MDDILKKAKSRTQLINLLTERIETAVSQAQVNLYLKLLNDVMNKLEVDGDQIKNSSKNKRLLSSVDSVFNNFAATDGLRIVNNVINAVNKVIEFNAGYFSEGKVITTTFDKAVKNQMKDWLGITEKGKVAPNGYLDKLIQDTTVRNQVKDLTFKNVISQAGFFETKKNLGEFINGNEEKAGALQKYYRNFAYDTVSVADRAVGIEYANKAGYEFAIYEGGLIKTSRSFCIERNGKVFHRSEIAKFKPTQAVPPNYNPFLDLGGYGCRHHLNWIANKVAFALRPDAKNLVGKKAEEPKRKPAELDMPELEKAVKEKKVIKDFKENRP